MTTDGRRRLLPRGLLGGATGPSIRRAETALIGDTAQPNIFRSPAARQIALARVRGWRMAVTLAATGVLAGLVGAGLTLLLHGVQLLAFGARAGDFTTAVEAAGSTRRVGVLALTGLVAGLGFWAVRRTPGSGLERTLWTGSGRLRPLRTISDGVLQIVVVGLGASLGREAAPREISAVAGQTVAEQLRLDPVQVRLVLACGSGAGLAAVYNVPLAGTVFIAELLVGSFSARVVVPAAATCTVATMVAWLVVPDRPVYRLATDSLDARLLVWAALAGPLLGLAGAAFVAMVVAARRSRPVGWRLVAWAVPVFAVLGVVALRYPTVLGNGQGSAALVFVGTGSLGMLAATAVIKPLVTVACLRAGATGGLITPSLSTGALAGGALGLVWHDWVGGTTGTGTFAMVGAAAVLATTLQAPTTAVVFVLELTGASLSLVPAVLLCVAGSVVTSRYVDGRSTYTLSRRVDRIAARQARRAQVEAERDQADAGG